MMARARRRGTPAVVRLPRLPLRSAFGALGLLGVLDRCLGAQGAAPFEAFRSPDCLQIVELGHRLGIGRQHHPGLL